MRVLLLAAGLVALSMLGAACGESACVFTPDDTHHNPAPAQSEAIFSKEVLHKIALVVKPEHLGALRHGKGPLTDEPRVPVQITFDEVTISEAKIRLKGVSTYVGIDGRASFSIKFTKGARLHGMKKILLHSTLHDPLLVRAPISYALAKKVHLPAPRVSYAEVTLNGELFGLYNIVEPINKQYLAAWFSEDLAWGNLYEASDFDVVGRASESPFAPDLKDLDEGRCLDDLRALQDALETATEDDFPAILEQHFDVDRLLRFIALESVVVRTDGFSDARNNFYLYHVPNSSFVLLPAGFDTVFHTAGRDPEDLSWAHQSGLGTRLIARLQRAPSLVMRYEQQTALVVDAFALEEMIDTLDHVDRLIHGVQAPSVRVQEEIDAFDEGKTAFLELLRAHAASLQR